MLSHPETVFEMFLFQNVVRDSRNIPAEARVWGIHLSIVGIEFSDTFYQPLESTYSVKISMSQ